jgi:hypothetical protein
LDGEGNYYGSIEDYFVERRGSPLFITPAEWVFIFRWEEQGIPLPVVKEGIDRVFERPRTRAKPRKLGYCRQTVEATFRRFREVSLGGREREKHVEPPFDPSAHLEEIAAALEGLNVPSAGGLASRVRDLIDSDRSLVGIEDDLTAVDQELLDAIEAELEDDVRSALLQESQDSLASYRERMPKKVYDAAVRSAYRRRLRAKLALPRVTLFDA